MKKVGLVGWRGMVGSVLFKRMLEEGDFNNFQPTFFSTSQTGQAAPTIDGKPTSLLEDAFAISGLSDMDIIITCQGSDYSKRIYPELIKTGWQGYWIDAASLMRMDEDSTIVLDPINKGIMEQAINQGQRKFIGGNCTVSLLLMAISGLLKETLVEWISTSTYQAVSGGGAKNVREMLGQMGSVYRSISTDLEDPATSILDIDAKVSQTLNSSELVTDCFKAPIAGNVLPWIDSLVANGQTREEWKAQAEANKILQRQANPIAIDGVCVRVGAMRCHSQALTIKLKSDIAQSDIEQMIKEGNPWVHWVPNEPNATLEQLTPAHISGSLSVAVGRARKMSLGNKYLSLFTVGDQLLWGAAEPLRRTLCILLNV